MEIWEAKRYQVCQEAPARRRNNEKYDVTTFKREEKFAEFWDEGKVMPLQQFLKEKDVDLSVYNTEAKQQKFVEEDL